MWISGKHAEILARSPNSEIPCGLEALSSVSSLQRGCKVTLPSFDYDRNGPPTWFKRVFFPVYAVDVYTVL